MTVIECPACHWISHHPVDVATGWCANCERFTGKTGDEVRAAAASEKDSGVAASILHRLATFGTAELDGEFTDDILSITRTTRRDFDAFRDWREVQPNTDELLVVTEAYDGDPSPKWCRVVGLAPGSASVYPYKVEIPERGVGQFAAREILGWRQPLERHRILRELRGLCAV